MSSSATVVVITVLGTLTKKAIAAPFDLSKRRGAGGSRSSRGKSGGAGVGGEGSPNKQRIILIVLGSIGAAIILGYLIFACVIPYCRNKQKERKPLQLRIERCREKSDIDDQRMLINSRPGTPRPYSPSHSLCISPALTPRVSEDGRSWMEAESRAWHPELGDVRMPDPAMLSVKPQWW